jgi:hypothetical protein
MATRRATDISSVRSAAKLLREVGGTPAPDLAALLERVIGWPFVVHRLADRRVLVTGGVFRRAGQVHTSEETLRAFTATIEARQAQPPGHPFGDAYPDGDGFIEAVPRLISPLPERLGIAAAALDGSVDGLDAFDRAARRFGGQACLDDPVLLAGLVAYVGEVARNAVGGSWAIDTRRFDAWEPIVVGGQREFRPFVIFKELLERGSIHAAITHYLGWSPAAAPRRAGIFADREAAQAAAGGALAAVPADTWTVLTRYGNGRPWSVRLTVDLEIAGIPLAAGSDAHVTRDGALISGVLSRSHAVLDIPFPRGTTIRLRTGRRSGVESAILGADQAIQGIPCQAGSFVQFRFHRRRPFLTAATLGAAHLFGGVSYPAGTWFALDRDGRLTDERPPGWSRSPRTSPNG